MSSAPDQTSQAAAVHASSVEEVETCPHCAKPLPLCVCEQVKPVDSRLSLLVLMHPQEQDKALATARLTAMHFSDAVVKIGLSWPSLSRILGREVDPQRWGILYLGSVNPAHLVGDPDQEVFVVDRKGNAEEHQRGILRGLEGIILLDGTWSQAKTLWWRNAWMLKCRRLVLAPKRASRYGKLRREPRREGLSTIEAAALVMSRLQGRPEIETSLMASFDAMLSAYRAALPSMPELAAKPRRKGGRRPASKGKTGAKDAKS
ncbi:MAG TPA: tRNA-uridine aminocarboxypropyltransferase [Xanthobacteraceae bacterium]|nr:tRNA-uridine aminocarboxypropyltransferase [Xanthobacteraceae bacterium]